MLCAAQTAPAQTAGYPSGTQSAPQNPNNQLVGGMLSAPQSQETSPYGAATSSLYGQIQAQSSAAAPPWILTEYAGVDEIATDNVNFTSVARQADLGSLFSAGGILTTDSARVTGILSLTGAYRRQIVDSALDHFLVYGYTKEEVTLVPGSLYLGLHGLMDDVDRVGLGLQNALAQYGNLTQIYQASASPLYYIDVNDSTFNLLRYEAGQVLFSRNDSSFNFQGLTIPGITNSTDQLLRDDFRMVGTVFQRLLTDISFGGASYNSGSQDVGDFTRERAEIVNAYALTRSLALVGAAGYERLHDRDFPQVSGQDATWSAGVRFLPNADSYALLTYGRQDLRTDFAGELAWNITPLTSVYMDYTDFVTTLQEQSIANINASEIGPFGAVTHVVFDQNAVINTIDDPLLSGTPDAGLPTTTLGAPLADVNNTLPLTNGLFRFKALRATANAQITDNVVSLTFLNFDQTRLAGRGVYPFGRTLTSYRAVLSWTRFLSPEVEGHIAANFERQVGSQSASTSASTSFGSANEYGMNIALNWRISQRLDAFLRYDFIDYSKSANIYENVVTVGLHKTFD